MKRPAEHAASVTGPQDPEIGPRLRRNLGVYMVVSTRSTRLADVRGMREPWFVSAWSRPHLAVDSSAVRRRWKPDA
jgi:hypothetical protein